MHVEASCVDVKGASGGLEGEGTHKGVERMRVRERVPVRRTPSPRFKATKERGHAPRRHMHWR